MSTMTVDIARERQLDWLLDEVLGSGRARAAQKKAPSIATHWLAAAIALLAIGTAFGVGFLNEAPKNSATPMIPTDQDPEQDREIPWYECHGVAAFARVPDDVINLKCFDFDDATLAKIARLKQLERLDLSGMDVNAKGYSESLKVTDAGIAHLASLTALRWLSLKGCNLVEGATLAKLRAIPRLEHLDCSSTAITSEAIATLPQLPSLRELSLTFCMDFHGRSLADIAKLPGLRRLELSYCPTISGADAMHLAKLHELRYLDLSLCMGAYLGQTAGIMLDDVTNLEEAALPPTRDQIGITDTVIAALAGLPLETLKLGGCHSLTDAAGASLAKMTSLHTLDIGDLPKTSGTLLEQIPTGLRRLSLDNNHHYQQSDLKPLSRFTNLRELGLNALKNLDDDGLAEALQGKQLQVLRLGGIHNSMMRRDRAPDRPNLTSDCRTALATQTGLKRLEVMFAEWLDEDALATLAKLPQLHHFNVQSTNISKDALRELAKSKSLREISFLQCREMKFDALTALQPLSLTYLDVYANKFSSDEVLKLASNWPGCKVRMPDAKIYRMQ